MCCVRVVLLATAFVLRHPSVAEAVTLEFLNVRGYEADVLTTPLGGNVWSALACAKLCVERDPDCWGFWYRPPECKAITFIWNMAPKADNCSFYFIDTGARGTDVMPFHVVFLTAVFHYKSTCGHGFEDTDCYCREGTNLRCNAYLDFLSIASNGSYCAGPHSPPGPEWVAHRVEGVDISLSVLVPKPEGVLEENAGALCAATHLNATWGSIEDAALNKAYQQKYKEPFIIGLYKPVGGTEMQWYDGQAVTYTNFKNSPTGARYTVFNPDGKWTYADDTAATKILCKRTFVC